MRAESCAFVVWLLSSYVALTPTLPCQCLSLSLQSNVLSTFLLRDQDVRERHFNPLG